MPRPLALLPLALALACAHAPAPAPATASGPPAPPPRDLKREAAALSEETRALLRAEGELLWTTWTTGGGAAPSTALAGHERLFAKESLETLEAAEAEAAAGSGDGGEKSALSLLLASLGPQAIARGAGDATLAFETAKAQLVYAAPGGEASYRERDLDRLLTDEPAEAKRLAIADAEAAAAAPLAALALAREKKEEETRAALGLPPWRELIARMYGRPPEELAALAEATLAATQEIARKAVASASERNLGLTLDRLRRADLPRLVRSAEADSEFLGAQGWEHARATLAAMQLDPLAELPGGAKLRVDGEANPAKAPRPLALLVDPPADVRLSFKSTGGFDEERALLHESSRALGGALTHTPRWELAQLGDGSATEGAAFLLESLSADPAWLRERTSLRGGPLGDLVHTEATRRLLAVRRAAALVLFEVQRRAGPETVESDAALYRALLTRATFAQHGEHEGARWPLEADGWIKSATSLRAALLGASLAISLEQAASAAAKTNPEANAPSTSASTNTSTNPGAAPGAAASPAAAPALPAWWHTGLGGDALRKLWSGGRALTAEQGAALSGVALDPDALSRLISERLAYVPPDAPPAPPRPDYKFMQGDRRPRKKHKAKKKQ